MSAMPAFAQGREKAQYLEAGLAQDIGQRNFIPNLLVHEYEALLFVDTAKFAEWASGDVVDTLAAARAGFATPEDINDGRETAPSKRIIAAMATYQKAFHGPLIATDIGLHAIRAACPHFNDWLVSLEALR